MIYSIATQFAQLLDRLGDHATRERKLGIAYILAKRGPPPYDVATIAAVLAGFKPSGVAEADAAHLTSAIDSLATIDAATIAARFPWPVDFVIVTDIAIGATDEAPKTAPKMADTDDSQLLGCLADALNASASASAAASVSGRSSINTVTVILSARKKGDDATTPSDVVAMMVALIPGAAPTTAPEADEASAMRSFSIGNTVVRVFQQAKQSAVLLSSAKELPPLQVGGNGQCLDDPVYIADLEAQNSEMHSYLRASLGSGRPCFFLGCGPTDVATARIISMAPSCTGYAISYKPNGVNTGAGMPFVEQHSHAGGKLIAAMGELNLALGEPGASIVEIGADVTRRLQQNAYLLGLGSAGASSAYRAYLSAIADNSWKVATKPLGAKPLPPSPDAQRAWKLAARINYSNPVSLFGGTLEQPLSELVSKCALGDLVDLGKPSVELVDRGMQSVELVEPVELGDRGKPSVDLVDLVELVDGAGGLSAAVPVLAGARAKIAPEVFAAIQRNAARFALVQTVNGLLAWGVPLDAAAIEAALAATTASGGGGVCLRIFGTASAPLPLPDGLLCAFVESAPEIRGVQTADQLFAVLLITMAARLCLVPIIAAEYGVEIHAADFVDEMPVPVLIESGLDGLDVLSGTMGLIGLRHSGQLVRL